MIPTASINDPKLLLSILQRLAALENENKELKARVSNLEGLLNQLNLNNSNTRKVIEKKPSINSINVDGMRIVRQKSPKEIVNTFKNNLYSDYENLYNLTKVDIDTLDQLETTMKALLSGYSLLTDIYVGIMRQNILLVDKMINKIEPGKEKSEYLKYHREFHEVYLAKDQNKLLLRLPYSRPEIKSQLEILEHHHNSSKDKLSKLINLDKQLQHKKAEFNKLIEKEILIKTLLIYANKPIEALQISNIEVNKCSQQKIVEYTNYYMKMASSIIEQDKILSQKNLSSEKVFISIMQTMLWKLLIQMTNISSGLAEQYKKSKRISTIEGISGLIANGVPYGSLIDTAVSAIISFHYERLSNQANSLLLAYGIENIKQAFDELPHRLATIWRSQIQTLAKAKLKKKVSIKTLFRKSEMLVDVVLGNTINNPHGAQLALYMSNIIFEFFDSVTRNHISLDYTAEKLSNEIVAFMLNEKMSISGKCEKFFGLDNLYVGDEKWSLQEVIHNVRIVNEESNMPLHVGHHQPSVSKYGTVKLGSGVIELLQENNNVNENATQNKFT